MKTILIAFDGPRCSPQTMEYATDIAKSCKSLLLGCFISDLSDQPVHDNLNEDYRNVVKLFEHVCDDKKVSYLLHKDFVLSVSELLDETSRTDLLILDTHSDLFWHSKNEKSSLFEKLISEAECPVITMLAKGQEVKNILTMSDEKITEEYALPFFC